MKTYNKMILEGFIWGAVIGICMLLIFAPIL